MFSVLQLLKRDREIKTLQETVVKLKQQLAAAQNAQQRMAKVREVSLSPPQSPSILTQRSLEWGWLSTVRYRYSSLP